MILTDNIKVYIQDRVELYDKVAIYIVSIQGNKRFIASIDSLGNLVFNKELIEGEMNVEPTLLIHKSILQMVIDGLGDKIPPTKEATNEAELRATKYHLEDLRALVFKHEKVDIGEKT